jgi:hypothetical protein
MKRILGLIAVLVLMSSVVWADDIMDKDLITPLRTDQVWLIDDPAEMPVEGRASIATIFGLLQASDVPDVSATYQAVASLETDVEALVDIEDLQGAATDAQVPNDITIDLATLASTVTVSDDESTNDEHEVVFTTDGATMESDGDFAYNPSTGTVSATVFSGTLAGANLDIVNMTGETSIAADDLIVIYDTSATANRSMTRGNFVSGIGAGQAIIFDIGDDGGNDSTDVGEIATTGDTNSIFTEPSADKILIDLGNNWPTADAAVAAASQVITDNAIATVDDADAADNDFAKFTANGLEGRSYAEVRQDLGIDSAANLETSLSLGAYASDILGAADSDALVTLLGLVAGDIPDLSATYEPQLVNSSGLASALSDETGTGAAVFGTNPTLTGVTLGGNMAVGAHEIQSTGNIVLQLGDNAGVNVFEIEDSDGNAIYSVNSDGSVIQAAVNDPYLLFNDNDEATEWAFKYSDTNNRLMVGTVTGGDPVNNFTEVGYWHADGMYYAGNMNISTGHTYQINGSQIALTNLSDGLSHAAGHIQGGADEIDGDLIDIDYAETNYTPATTGVASDVNHLAAHLEGIDAAIGALGGGTLVGLTDVGGDDVYTGGYILVGDNSDSYDPKAVGGDATLAADGTLTIAANAVENSMMADNSVNSAEIAAGAVDPAHVASGAWDFGTSVEADTLTEGGNAVWNDADTDVVDNSHINWADIDYLEDEGRPNTVRYDCEDLGDDTYRGDTVILDCGDTDNCAVGDIVFVDPSDGDPLKEADATAASGEFPAFGIVVAAANDGSPATVLIKGCVRDDDGYDWTDTAPTDFIFLGESDGTSTQDKPDTTGDCVQIIGMPVSADVAFYDFGRPYALSD